MTTLAPPAPRTHRNRHCPARPARFPCRLLTARHLTCLARPAVNKAQSVQAFAAKRPVLGSNVFVAPNASVVGDVQLGNGSSVWYGAIIRGELAKPALRRAHY